MTLLKKPVTKFETTVKCYDLESYYFGYLFRYLMSFMSNQTDQICYMCTFKDCYINLMKILSPFVLVIQLTSILLFITHLIFI